MPNCLHRYHGAGYLHFITTSCYQRRALLGSRQNRDLFLEVMEQVRRRYHFVVIGYVVMPEHVHLLFGEPERGDPSIHRTHASSETRAPFDETIMARDGRSSTLPRIAGRARRPGTGGERSRGGGGR
jgi:REP element-mobilizing transposase RayT